MGHPAGSGWTEEQDTLLRKLWCVEGLSATKIEPRMPGRTRNAIIGRVQRLGIGGKGRAESTRAQQHIKPPKPVGPRRPSVPRGMIRFGNVSITKSVIPDQAKPVSPKSPAPERITAEPVTLADRRPDQCGWPVNDGGPFLYCGAYAKGRYCDHHAALGMARGRAIAC
jgi:GcrA cell cycle regulator